MTDIKPSDWNSLIKDYNPVAEKFILDDLLAQIPPYLHKKAYFELKTAEGYPTIARLRKIVLELRFSVLSEIEDEAITFAKNLVNRMNIVSRSQYESGGIEAVANIQWVIISKVGSDEPYFDKKERYALDKVEVDNKDFFLNPDHYINKFAKYYYEAKTEKLGLALENKSVVAKLQNIKMIAN